MGEAEAVETTETTEAAPEPTSETVDTETTTTEDQPTTEETETQETETTEETTESETPEEMSPEDLQAALDHMTEVQKKTHGELTRKYQEEAAKETEGLEATTEQNRVELTGKMKESRDQLSAVMVEAKEVFEEDSTEYRLFSAVENAVSTLFEPLAGIEEAASSIREVEAMKTLTLGLIDAHPDAPRVIKSEEFTLWLSDPKTPKMYRTAMKTRTVEDVNEVLDTFKYKAKLDGKAAYRETRADKNKERLGTTTAPGNNAPQTTETKRSFSRRELASMSLATYNKLRDEIADAEKNGRITQ